MNRARWKSSSASGEVRAGADAVCRLKRWLAISAAAKFIRESIDAVENHSGPSAQPFTSGGS